MSDQPYTKRELDSFFKDIGLRFDTQDKILAAILTQTQKTNGRVTKLEFWRGMIMGGLCIISAVVLPVLFILIEKFLGIIK